MRQESLGKEEAKAETFRRDPAGSQPRPAEPGQQPEASLAWCPGNRHREAETASERAVPLSPEIDTIAGADGVYSPEGRVAAPQRPGVRDPAGVGEQGTLTHGSPRNLGGPDAFSVSPGRRYRVTNSRLAAGAPGGHGTETRVRPGYRRCEGDEARRDGRRGVGAPRTTCDAGEPSRGTPPREGGAGP